MLPRTATLPKSLLPVAGRPFIDWQLDLLATQGVERVTICAGHLGAALRQHVGDGSARGLAVTWVDEGEAGLGTAGALRLALDRGALDPEFFVLYGDSYLEVRMVAVEAAWRESGLPALMTVCLAGAVDAPGNAVYARGRIRAYDKSRPAELRPAMSWIDFGLSILTAPELDRRTVGGPSDLADLLRDLAREGLLAGFETARPYHEIGSPEGLAKLERHLLRTSAPPLSSPDS